MISRTGFDHFLNLWRKNVNIDSPEYICADAVFHELHYSEEKPNARQHFGIISWVIWWFKQTLCSLTQKQIKLNFPQNKPYWFVLMPTPAHEKTLEPIFDQIDIDEKCRFATQVSHETSDSFQLPACPRDLFAAFSILKHIFKVLARVDLILTSLRGRKLTVSEKGRVAARAYDCLNAIYWIHNSIRQPINLFITYELPAIQKAFVYLNKLAGGRSIHVMHGQRLDLYQMTNATDLVLFSKIDEPWFRAHVDPAIRIWTIGHPRLEDIRKQVGPKLSHSPHRKPRITFFSQSFDSDYSPEQRLIDFKILAGLRGQAELRLRAHPSETNEMLFEVQQMAQLDFASISDNGLVEDLKWCDAAASSWSTVSMEAAACGRGIFWTCNNPEPYKPSRELRDNGIGVLLRRPGDWSPYLEQWKNQGWGPPVRVEEARLRDLGMIGEMNKPWVERLEILK